MSNRQHEGIVTFPVKFMHLSCDLLRFPLRDFDHLWLDLLGGEAADGLLNWAEVGVKRRGITRTRLIRRTSATDRRSANELIARALGELFAELTEVDEQWAGFEIFW